MPGNQKSTASLTPPPASVPRNRWDLLHAPPLTKNPPSAPVSIIIPYYNVPQQLSITLSALTHQEYPINLLEVIVADDGSSEPPPIDRFREHIDLSVVRQDDLGYRAGAARNLGAQKASHDILIFLDSDMVPDRLFVAGHVRWHQLIADAVTLGPRTHVDFDGVSPQDVAEAAAGGNLEDLFDDREHSKPEYLEFHLARTKDLTSHHDDLFRTVASGNMGLRRDAFFRVGGFDESFTDWGCEDTEFGYRLFNDGCLLIPEPFAHCWHQGLGHIHDSDLETLLENQRAKLSHLVPHRSFRRSVAGRSFSVPRVEVQLCLQYEPKEQSAAVIESVLGSRFHDLFIIVRCPSDHPDLTWLTRQFDPDPRVSVSPHDHQEFSHTKSPIQIIAPPSAIYGPNAIGGIVKRMENQEEPIGVLHLTIPTVPPDDDKILVLATRALNRAHRVGPEMDPVVEAARLFGEWWASGHDYEVTPYSADGRLCGDAARKTKETVRSSPQDELAIARAFLTGLSPKQRQLLMGFAQRGAKALSNLQEARQASSISGRMRHLRRAGGAFTPYAIRRLLYRFVYPLWRRLRASATGRPQSLDG